MIDNKLSKYKNLVVKDIYKNGNYVFISLDNGQNILLNEKKIYDISEYDAFFEVINMNNINYAILSRDYDASYVINLETKKVVFKDKNVYHISKADDKCLHIIRNIGDNTIYNIETKKYLTAPLGYEFEKSLKNNLYVFKEKNNNKGFFDSKRLITDFNGNVLLRDLEGLLNFRDNHLIVDNDDILTIINLNDIDNLQIKTVKNDQSLLAKPKIYGDGKVLLIKENTISLYDLDLKLRKEIKVDNLKEIIDLEIVDVLKLLIPSQENDQVVNKHLFINLETEKSLSHSRIAPFPYFNPSTYVGMDYLNGKEQNFYFYDKNFNLIRKIKGCKFDSIDCNKECMFCIENNGRKQVLNTETGLLKDISYDYIKFHVFEPYGYGIDLEKEKMDFFDLNLNVIIKDFDYNKYNINIFQNEFSYFIINDYLCISSHIVDCYGQSHYRRIIEQNKGPLIFDKVDCDIYPLDSYIKIVENGENKYFNTETGQFTSFAILAPINDEGKIDFTKLDSSSLIIDQKIKVKKLKRPF